jgi:hypothetical protein
MARHWTSWMVMAACQMEKEKSVEAMALLV